MYRQRESAYAQLNIKLHDLPSILCTSDSRCRYNDDIFIKIISYITEFVALKNESMRPTSLAGLCMGLRDMDLSFATKAVGAPYHHNHLDGREAKKELEKAIDEFESSCKGVYLECLRSTAWFSGVCDGHEQ